ncbi:MULTISPECIES: invasion associated locus B family protein [unclassified Caulobacter]|uniref:invasion associated locus B family protein n=1 Tax=unclassified Caulobacter TaxID=2648921 RepID=UPI000D373663|nr:MULTISPECIES: invasion associated locus B family protein [unclassified Caulobacter]PTS86231.1 invasion-associated locus B family protein [Caulobacter sp. HMWF009]PTT06270.1 invasion-associated locus B family protein [Caulobacter sp. HMWF025]
MIRRSTRRFAAILVATTGIASASPTFAESSAIRTIGDWQLRCETAPARACALVQSVVDEARTKVRLSIVALKTTDRTSILRVVTPLGVLLPSGVGLRIDQTEMGEAAFLRCMPSGCVAEIEMTADQIARLSAGTTATFTLMQTPAEGVAIPIGLKGFREGFAALP